MSAATSIEWTDRTWNPVRGCSRVSEGCRNCYAERLAARFSDEGMWGHRFAERLSPHSGLEGARKPWVPRWTGRVELVDKKLREPLSWRTNPREIPNGYSEEKHRELAGTIRSGPGSILDELRIMACHETHDDPCVGWLAHRLGPGNNFGLRLAVMEGRVSAKFDLVGEQHARFEDTLPEPEE